MRQYAEYDYNAMWGAELYGWTIDGQGVRVGIDGAVIIGSMVWSALDAYYSAKRINLEAEKKASSTSLDYTPHHGMMASYNVKF